jgi:hypothetical protein
MDKNKDKITIRRYLNIYIYISTFDLFEAFIDHRFNDAMTPHAKRFVHFVKLY